MQEAFYCVYLDRKNHLLDRNLITLGKATGTLVTPKEVFRGAIIAGAVAMIVAHKRRSVLKTADISVTRQLREAARILYIQMLDHVVCGKANADPHRCGFYS